MIKKILVVIIIIIICIVVISVYGFFVSIHPRRFISKETPKDYGLEYEDVVLVTEDNLKLKAWFIPSNYSNAAIIVSHGYPFDKGNVLGFAPFLHEHYNLLFFDFRGMGESEGKFTSVGYYEKRDVEAAIKYLKKRNITDIGGIGFSLGGATLIMTNSKDMKAIVADSSYANLDLMVKDLYRQFFIFKEPFVYITKILSRFILKMDPDKVAPMEVIKEAKMPVLLIHGGKDSQIAVENSRLLHKANPRTELWIVEEADHGEAHYLRKDEYEKRVLEFFDKYLIRK